MWSNLKKVLFVKYHPITSQNEMYMEKYIITVCKPTHNNISYTSVHQLTTGSKFKQTSKFLKLFSPKNTKQAKTSKKIL